jgi:hypothetical protein
MRCAASRHFRNKRKKYLEAKIYELETKSTTKNIRDLYKGIIEFKKGYQPRTNIVQGEKSDLFTDCNSIWLGVGIISLSSSLYIGLVMLGRQKYIQQNL